MDILNSLNDKQREAASHDQGPILVIAGAGTGKTKVLTHRTTYLIESGKAKPWEVLAITFTNKAANEMKDRISNLIDYPIDRMWIGTFHSICVRILRRFIDRIGYDKNFIIYDDDDQKTLIKDCIKELDLDPKYYSQSSIKEFISNEKNRRNSPDKYINENYSNYINRNKGEIYALYEKKLKASNALDFDDLIIKTLELFEKNEDVLDFYQDKFKYILVDEYQDTNNAQYKLIILLGRKNDGSSNVFVVGDEDQSIYGWRGADITNILNFENDFKGAKIVKLERNYRSTAVILNAANQVIKNNCQRKGKKLYTEQNEGNLIRIIETADERDEAFTIAALIRREHRENKIDYSQIALLYRTNAQSRALEEGLIGEGIPYKIVGGVKFYDRKEIKDIMAYLRLILNQKDDVSFDRIINVPRRKLGDKAREAISNYALENGLSKFEACFDFDKLGLQPSAAKSIESFVSVMEMLMIKKDVMPLSQFIINVIEDTGLKDMLLQDPSVEGRSRLENVDEFLSAAKDFEERYEENSLEDFLVHISLLSDLDKTAASNDVVTLMTVHSAKGLEFDTVFITGLEDGMFPSIHNDEEDNIEEERRLFYVAITRAKRMLYMTHARDRIRYGSHEMRMKSRFLDEIPQECIEESDSLAFGNKKLQQLEHRVARKTGFFADRAQEKDEVKPKLKESDFKLGDKVWHKLWGKGTVVQLKDDIIVIAFESKGIRNLNLEYAPIEKL